MSEATIERCSPKIDALPILVFDNKSKEGTVKILMNSLNDISK